MLWCRGCGGYQTRTDVDFRLANSAFDLNDKRTLRGMPEVVRMTFCPKSWDPMRLKEETMNRPGAGEENNFASSSPSPSGSHGRAGCDRYHCFFAHLWHLSQWACYRVDLMMMIDTTDSWSN